MGTGYTRNDTPNNIADGNVINASDLDGEFDAIQAAFNATTGHSHDGTTGEGPQIDTAGLADDAVTGAKIDSTTTITAAGFSGPLTGTASNAALLDSLDSTQFLRSDAADTKTSGDLSFSDAVYAYFGTGNDLKIGHTGSASVIQETGTGDLYIDATNFQIRNGAGTETLATLTTDGAVTLYYDNAAKLATTATGADITGTLTADGLTVDTTGIVYSGGNVGIGTSPSTVLHLNDTTDPIIRLQRGGGVYSQVQSDGAGSLYLSADAGNTGSSSRIQFNVDGSEAARIDSNGRFLVGKTAYGSVSTDGTTIDPSFFQTSASNDRPMLVNRNGTDGNLIEFSKAGAAVGSIGTVAGDLYIANAVDVGLYLESSGTDHIAPCDISGAKRDAAIDLGAASARFRNGYFSGTVYADQLLGQNDTNTGIAVGGNDVLQLSTGGSERARVDASGNLLVGRTSTSDTNVGGMIRPDGFVQSTRDGNIAADFNRNTSDGDIVRFSKSSSSVGTIGVSSGDNLYLTGQTGNTGGIYMNDAAVSPAYQGVERDAYYDLGKGAARWKDAHFSGTVNATSYTGDGSSLTGIAAGATGGGSDEIFWENGQTVTTNYTITNGKNAMSAGPITINTGVTVTVGTGETWTVV